MHLLLYCSVRVDRSWLVDTWYIVPRSFRGRMIGHQLVRWSTGERLTNRLPLLVLVPTLSLTTLSPPGTAGQSGPDPIYGSMCPHVTNLRFHFLGAQREYFSRSTWGSSTFQKATYECTVLIFCSFIMFLVLDTHATRYVHILSDGK